MCTYVRISLARSPSRSPSSDRTSFTRRVFPLCAPRTPAPSTFRTGPSFLSFPPAMLTLVALTIPRSLFQPLSPSLAPSRFLQRRASARRSRFPPPPGTSYFFFPEHAPEPPSDFYNLLLVAPHTTGRRCRCCRHRRVSGAAHPEKPENRGKQKRPARRAAHPAGVVRSNGGARGSGGRTLRATRGNGAAAGVADEKRKRHRGTPTQRIIRASACARLSRARGS